jgi:general secretion pathway protein K
MNPVVTRTGARRGIALIIVMLVIAALSVLAAGFAFSMKVETKLARNTQFESEMLWMAWSGVELSRYVLGQQLTIPGEQTFTALNQLWAGGPGGTNDLLADIQLENIELGPGRISVRIEDLERRFNVNFAPPEILERALELVGVDLLDAGTIIAAIEDWRDPDQDPRIGGAESDYYLSLPQPYWAKDGPIDDLSELLLVRGITPELYWGPGSTETHGASMWPPRRETGPRFLGGAAASGPVGLVDLFNATSGRREININTASPAVLQLLPGIDANLAAGIVETRAGPDGIDGTEDDTPFHTVGELINVPGMVPQFVQALQRLCTVQSRVFDVRVEIDVGQYQRTFLASLVRLGARQVIVMNGSWE